MIKEGLQRDICPRKTLGESLLGVGGGNLYLNALDSRAERAQTATESSINSIKFWYQIILPV